MFESGSVTLNGVVKPANSTVALAPNCGFFSWTEQMFLWLTSPAPSRYGGGSRIMFSPAFFTVSPEDSGGRRTFIRNQANGILRMGLRMTELGPHNLPALVSRSGQVIEVQRPDPKRPVPPVVRLQDGRSIRLGDVKVAPGNRLQFFDTTGKQVQVKRLAPPPTPRIMVRMTDGTRSPDHLRAELVKPIQARKLVFRGIPIFIDPANNVIDVEPGQADGGVLTVAERVADLLHLRRQRRIRLSPDDAAERDYVPHQHHLPAHRCRRQRRRLLRGVARLHDRRSGSARHRGEEQLGRGEQRPQPGRLRPGDRDHPHLRQVQSPGMGPQRARP